MSSSERASSEPGFRLRTASRALVIGVVAGSGSGKRTVARGLCRGLSGEPVLFDQGAYYQALSHLTPEERRHSVELMVEQYPATVRPMHRELVEPSGRHADFMLSEGGLNRVAVELLEARIARELERRRGAWPA